MLVMFDVVSSWRGRSRGGDQSQWPAVRLSPASAAQTHEAWSLPRSHGQLCQQAFQCQSGWTAPTQSGHGQFCCLVWWANNIIIKFTAVMLLMAAFTLSVTSMLQYNCSVEFRLLYSWIALQKQYFRLEINHRKVGYLGSPALLSEADRTVCHASSWNARKKVYGAL